MKFFAHQSPRIVDAVAVADVTQSMQPGAPSFVGRDAMLGIGNVIDETRR